jgi:hypothetical protein
MLVSRSRSPKLEARADASIECGACAVGGEIDGRTLRSYFEGLGGLGFCGSAMSRFRPRRFRGRIRSSELAPFECPAHLAVNTIGLKAARTLAHLSTTRPGTVTIHHPTGARVAFGWALWALGIMLLEKPKDVRAIAPPFLGQLRGLAPVAPGDEMTVGGEVRRHPDRFGPGDDRIHGPAAIVPAEEEPDGRAPEGQVRSGGPASVASAHFSFPLARVFAPR